MSDPYRSDCRKSQFLKVGSSFLRCDYIVRVKVMADYDGYRLWLITASGDDVLYDTRGTKEEAELLARQIVDYLEGAAGL